MKYLTLSCSTTSLSIGGTLVYSCHSSDQTLSSYHPQQCLHMKCTQIVVNLFAVPWISGLLRVRRPFDLRSPEKWPDTLLGMPRRGHRTRDCCTERITLQRGTPLLPPPPPQVRCASPVTSQQTPLPRFRLPSGKEADRW